MKALSIRQPWASLIVEGRKNIENRSWPTKFRGRIYIHASLRFDKDALAFLKDKDLMLNGDSETVFYKLPRGSIIGEVSIIDCVAFHPSPWFSGPFGFVLSNPVKFDSFIPCKGQLNFFEPKILGNEQSKSQLSFLFPSGG